MSINFWEIREFRRSPCVKKHSTRPRLISQCAGVQYVPSLLLGIAESETSQYVIGAVILCRSPDWDMWPISFLELILGASLHFVLIINLFSIFLTRLCRTRQDCSIGLFISFLTIMKMNKGPLLSARVENKIFSVPTEKVKLHQFLLQRLLKEPPVYLLCVGHYRLPRMVGLATTVHFLSSSHTSLVSMSSRWNKAALCGRCAPSLHLSSNY